MKKIFVFLLLCTTAWGQATNPTYVEELSVGKGYDNTFPGDGSGLDIDSDGKIWSNAGAVFGAELTIADDVILYWGTDEDIGIVYDEAGDDRLEWTDGTNLLMYLVDAGTTGNLSVSGSITSDGSFVGNEGGGDNDSRIESVGNANMFYVDAGGSAVGIGTAPEATVNDILHVANSGSANYTFISLDNYATTNTRGTHLSLRKSGSATLGALLVTSDGENLGKVRGWGVDTDNAWARAIDILFLQDGAAGSGYVPGRIEFHVAKTAASVLGMTLDSDKKLTVVGDGSFGGNDFDLPHATPTIEVGGGTGTLTIDGDLNVDGSIPIFGDGSAHVTLLVDGAASQFRSMHFQTNGSVRWAIDCDSTAESGADAGSNFSIRARNDAGGAIDAPLTIARVAGGTIAFGAARPVTFGGGYGSTGVTISSAGVGQFNGALTTDGVLTAASVSSAGHVASLSMATGSMTIGDSTNKTSISATGDQTFHGSGGIPYGSLYQHETATTIDLVDDTYVKITGFTTGLTNLVTINSDAFNVDTIGVYKITWSLSVDPAAVSDIHFDLFLNGVEQGDGSARRKFGTANDHGNIGGVALLDVTNTGHDIDLRAKNITNSNDMDVYHANFVITMVGGT